nr:MAG TPA: nucelotide kinase [Caudoviricetes sp.]
MEEIKQLSLSELGLEVETTPAEKAAANENAVEVKPITEEPPVTTVSKSSLSDTVEPAETKAVKSSLAEIAKNTAFDEEGLTQYGEVIRNVDKIAKKPKTKIDDPIRKNIEGLVDLADHEIERTKAELTGPEGIITKGKEEYVNRQYDRLMARAKNTPRLAEFIKKIEEIIETEPRFDGITEYERKGYILFTVARDKTVETDNVKSPKHYMLGDLGIEVKDVIFEVVKDMKGSEAVCVGNILKYVMRARKKNGIEDYQKAYEYLGYLLEELCKK